MNQIARTSPRPLPTPARMAAREASAAKTRETVLGVARALFQHQPYEAVTVREIARIARCSTGGVYQSWSSKADLYAEIYGLPPVDQVAVRELIAAVKAFLAWYDPAAEDIAPGLEEVVQRLRHAVEV